MRSRFPLRTGPARLCLVAAAVALPVCRPGAAEIISGFETGADLQRWSPVGQLTGERVAVPAPPEAVVAGPAGSGVRIATAGKAGLVLKAGELPANLPRFDTLRFWVHRGEQAAPSTIEVRFYEADGKAWFWRKIVLDHAGWKCIDVPLKWTRWSTSRIPRWQNVDRAGIFFRDKAELILDSFALDDDPPVNQPDELPLPTPADIAAVAFAGPEPATPPALPPAVRVARRAGSVVVTDVAELEIDRLLEHLETVEAAVRRDLPFARKSTAPVVLVVFADEADYKAFPPALAARVGAQAAPAPASGFTFLGIATSSWHPRFGTLRPVYTHEFVHAQLSAALHLDNRNEWFQEGMATRQQLTFHPEPGFGAGVLRKLEVADADTLRTVCNGEAIPLDRYWVAGTVCQMLAEEPDLAAKLPELVAGMQDRGLTALDPLLPTLGLTWEQLDERWRGFCRRTYATP